MHAIFLIISIACFARNSLSDSDLPPSIKICSSKDSKYKECLQQAILDALKLFEAGIPEKQIKSVEPLEVDNFEIKPKPGQFGVTQQYKNCKIHGLSKKILKGIKVIPDSKCHFIPRFLQPRIEIICDYVAEGKILLFTTKGFGKSNITMIDTDVKVEGNCEEYEKNNKKYIKLTKMDFDMRPKKILFDFENIFNGNEELSRTLNTVLNDNAKLLFEEYGPEYQKSVGKKFLRVAQTFVDDIPSDKLFLN